jgi:hypothetical protein
VDRGQELAESESVVCSACDGEYILHDEGALDTVIAYSCPCGQITVYRISQHIAAGYRDASGSLGEEEGLRAIVEDFDFDDMPCERCHG